MLNETLHLEDHEGKDHGKAPELSKKSSNGGGFSLRGGFQLSTDDKSTSGQSSEANSSHQSVYIALPDDELVWERKPSDRGPSLDRTSSKGGPTLERKPSALDRAPALDRVPSKAAPALDRVSSSTRGGSISPVPNAANVERKFSFSPVASPRGKNDASAALPSAETPASDGVPDAPINEEFKFPITEESEDHSERNFDTPTGGLVASERSATVPAEECPTPIVADLSRSNARRIRSTSAPIRFKGPFESVTASTSSRIEESPPPRHRSMSNPRFGIWDNRRVSQQGLVSLTDFSSSSSRHLNVVHGGKEQGVASTLKRLRAMGQQTNRRLMTPEFTKAIQSAESWRENPGWLWALRILALLASAIAVLVIVMVPTLHDPADGGSKNMVFGLFVSPYIAFFGCTATSLHALAVLKRSLPFWKVAFGSMCAAILVGVVSAVMNAFEIFPVPYWPVVAGSFAVSTCLSVTMAFQKKEDLRDPVMRKKLPWMMMQISLNVGSLFMYAFYVALFNYATGHWQSAVAPLLTVVKMGVKYCTSTIVARLDNPDFRHGTALLADVSGTCVSSIIFVSVNNIETFLLLIAIDTGINLKHCLGILSEISLSQKVKHQRIVRHLCLSRRDPQSCALALQEIKADALSPELVELCGDLFFAELTESIVPLIMGLSAWVVYYLPNCNRRWVTYMWQNTEAEFNQGMSYLMLDCAVQLALFFGLIRYMYFKVNVPIAHVGLVIMNQNKLLFSFIMFGIPAFVCLVFIDHSGVDTTLSFDWLKNGYNSTSIVRLCRPCD